MHLSMLVRRFCLATAACFVCIHPAAVRSESDALHLDLGAEVRLDLVEISPGTFLQGSAADEPGHRLDETQREVRATKKYLLGKYPVTRVQFARFVADSGYRTEAETGVSGGFGWSGTALVQKKEFTWQNPGFSQTPNDPVTLVTYNDAQAFLKWLSQKCGREFRLPTEAEWEYAARAGTKTPWPNGADQLSGDAVSWNKANAGNTTHPVGQKPDNAWGLSDMFGNVWEWCEDWYGPYASGPATDPLQTNPKLSDKPRRVLRGGSWLRDRMDCRVCARYRNDPASRNADNGFRVATSVTAPHAAPPVERASSVFLKRERFANLQGPAGHRVVTKTEKEQPVMEGGLGGTLVVFIIFGAIYTVIRSVIRGGSSASRSAGFVAGGRTFTRIGNDGFWITGDIASGTPLLCCYDAGAGMQETRVRFEPGPEGHFIYTGSRPSHITVVNLAATSQGGPIFDDDDVEIRNIPPSPPPVPQTPPPPPPTYDGPPPAY